MSSTSSPSPLLDKFLANTAQRISAVFLGRKSDNNSSFTLPLRVQQVRKDPRFLKAQTTYLQRRSARSKALKTIQAELVALQQAPTHPEELVTAAQNGRQQRVLQFQEEDWRDRQTISKIQRNLMQDVQASEVRVKLQEMETSWNRNSNWLSILSREETEQILLDGREQHRLLMLVSPPDISEDCPESFQNNLEKDIRNGLKGFMMQYYSLDNKQCPVEFYGKYFNRSIFDAEVKQLEVLLAPIPTVILYSDVTDYEVHFHVGFWGLLSSTVSMITVQPWNWEGVKEELESTGRDEKQSLRLVRQLIVTIHKLLASFLADLYYLSIDPCYEPQLFHLGLEFSQEGFSQAWVTFYTDILREVQQQQRAGYESELRSLVASAGSESKSQSPRSTQASVNPINRINQMADYQPRPKEQSEMEAAGRNFADEIRQQRQVKDPLEQEYRQKAEFRLKQQVWKCVRTIGGLSGTVDTIAIPNGQTLVSTSASHMPNETISIRNLETGELLRHLPIPVAGIDAITLNTSGQFVAIVSDQIAVFNVNTGQPIFTLPGTDIATLSGDGKFLASSQMGYEDGSFKHWLEVWNLQSRTCLHSLTKHEDYFRSVAFSLDNLTLAGGSEDHHIMIWNIRLQTAKLIHTLAGHTETVSSLSFSPKEQILASGASDKTIRVWSLHTGTLLHTLTGHHAAISSLAFSADGAILASGSLDNSIKLWDAATGDLLQTLTGHLGAVTAIGFSPVNATLISSSNDSTIRIWQPDRTNEKLMSGFEI